MKHYLQVTDRQFSEAAGVAQGVAPAQVIGNQGISENSPTLKNKAFPIIDLHGQSQEMPLVGDEGLERWCSKAFVYRSNVGAGHFSGGAGGGAYAT